MDVEEIMLGNIKKQPALYLGRPSLTLLSTFMNGYLARQYEIYANTQPYYDSEKFQKYVKGYYGVSENAFNYYSIICDNCSDEEEAFYKFYELLEAFKSENP